MAAPLISKEDQQTAANLCTHDPAIVVDTADHRQDRNERKTPIRELLRGAVK